jgi:hypothetical protein
MTFEALCPSKRDGMEEYTDGRKDNFRLSFPHPGENFTPGIANKVSQLARRRTSSRVTMPREYEERSKGVTMS